MHCYNFWEDFLKSVVNGNQNSLNTSGSAEKDSDWNGCFLTYTPPPPSPYLWDQGKVSLGKGREAPFVRKREKKGGRSLR